MTNFDFSVSRFPHLWDDTFYVRSELRGLLTGSSSENCSNIKRIWACSCLDLSLKIHQYRGDKKTVLYFVFLVVLEWIAVSNCFLVSLNAGFWQWLWREPINSKIVCNRINFLRVLLYLSCPRGIILYNLLIGSYSYPYYIIAMPVAYVYKLYSYTPFGLKMVARIYPQF